MNSDSTPASSTARATVNSTRLPFVQRLAQPWRHMLAGLSIVGALTGCTTETPRTGEVGATAASCAERCILVTFQDRTVGRNMPSNVLDNYRPHGTYDGSDWRTRTAQALANRYHLRFLTEWPVAALGLACVVYEVPPPHPVPSVLQQVASDDQVEFAQPMNRFAPLK